MEPDTTPDTAIDDTLLSLRTTLKQMARWGCQGFACSDQTLATLEKWAKPRQFEFGAERLDQIRTDLGECQRCPLSKSRTQLVFGAGDPQASLVFVGEGPGFEEDRSGRPFVGPAGQLLTRIIEAMQLTRDQVYICNVVKCRPPGNRNPSSEEIGACRPYLDRQLAAIQPKVVCTLGTFAAQTLLNTTAPVSRLRGRFHDGAGFRIMPTYHPAYLLRNPDQKKAVWTDVKKIMALLRI